MNKNLPDLDEYLKSPIDLSITSFNNPRYTVVINGKINIVNTILKKTDAIVKQHLF
jgi:hypothetical protein